MLPELKIASHMAGTSALIAQVLLAWSPGAQLAYVGQVGVNSRDRHGGRFVRRMEHLMCYLPGAAQPCTTFEGRL